MAYEIDLPSHWGIHPVISVQQLTPAPRPERDPYRRHVPPPGPVVPETDVWEIEAIVRKRKDARGRGGQASARTQYLVRWKRFGADEDRWVNAADIDAPNLIREYERSQQR